MVSNLTIYHNYCRRAELLEQLKRKRVQYHNGEFNTYKRVDGVKQQIELVKTQITKAVKQRGLKIEDWKTKKGQQVLEEIKNLGIRSYTNKYDLKWDSLTTIQVVAISQIGVSESGVDNAGEPSKRYSKGKVEAWCQNFVNWVLKTSGIKLPPNLEKPAWTDYMIAQFKKQNQFTSIEKDKNLQKIKPGDIIYHGHKIKNGYDATHTAVVIGINADGTIQTVDGNLGDAGKGQVKEINVGKDDKGNFYGLQGDHIIIGYATPGR